MNYNHVFPRMHVSLYVSDLEKSLDFYSAFFGQNPAKVKPRYAKYVLESPSLIISFVENAERVRSNFGHLGFQVETLGEMHARLADAQAKGLVSEVEIGTACCYAKQDKFWATDPDGVEWEVYYFHEDAEFNDPRYAPEDAAACACPVGSAQSGVVIEPMAAPAFLLKVVA
jgi:catechol 2,3-dioxygenase-like lactoylglutathione lyase family enzyme